MTVISKLREKRNLFAIFFIALIVRILYILLHANSTTVTYDSAVYDSLALGIIERGEFYFEKMHSSHPPLYPFFLAAIYKLFGHSFTLVRFIQSFLDALTCVLICLVSEKLTQSKKWAWGAGIFSAFYYGLIHMSAAILTESLFTFLFTLSIFLLIDIEKNNYIKTALAGFVLGLTTLTRAIPLLMLFLIPAWLFVKYRLDVKSVLRNFIAVLLPFIITLIPWTVRNYKIHGVIVPINIEAGYAFWSSNNPYGLGINPFLQPETKELAKKYSSTLPEAEKDRKFFQEGLKFLKSQTLLQNIKSVLHKYYCFLFPSIEKYDVTFVMIAPFALYGMWIMLKSNSLIYYVLLNFIISTTIFVGYPRFRNPASPFIIMFGAAGIKSLFERCKNKRNFYFFSGLWVLLNLILFYMETVLDFDFGLF